MPLSRTALLIGASVVALCGVPAAAWHRMIDQSFNAPFAKFDASGKRDLATFRHDGDTVLNEHFVRLTADRQSKQGYLWGKKQVNTDNWGINLGFRVSGQGKSLFGDGLVFWYTDMASYRRGSLFGVSSTFKGFAVVLDTFKNAETAHAHKDISVLLGSGNDVLKDKELLKERPGCDANVRYWEGADSFKASESRSHLKISLKDRILTVMVDEGGTGNFRQCFTSQNVLPADFDLKRGYFGLTGTTGQLADNHDVLFFQAYELESKDAAGPDPALHHKQAPEDPMKPQEDPNHEDYDPEAALRTMIAKEKKRSQALLDDVKHEIDHKLTHMKDDLKKMVGKIRTQEQKLEGRVGKIEDRALDSVVKELKEHVESRLDDMGTILSENVEQRLQELESHFEIHSESIKLDVHADLHADMVAETEGQVRSVLKGHLEAVKSQSSSFLGTFMMVLVVVVVAVGAVYAKLSRDMKRMRKGSWLD